MRKMTWRDRRAARRVQAGDGQPLPRFRWWQLLSRSLLTLKLPTPEGATSTHTIDVRHLGDRDDGEVRARLYVDGLLAAHSKLPARFSVPSGHIDVAVGNYGLRRCHYVHGDGTETQLRPHPATAEGRRAALQRNHPRVSRLVGIVATFFVLAGVCVALPQIAQTISQVPPIAESLGVFESPVRLSATANIVVGIVAVLGSTERALRLRSNWLDNLAS